MIIVISRLGALTGSVSMILLGYWGRTVCYPAVRRRYEGHTPVSLSWPCLCPLHNGRRDSRRLETAWFVPDWQSVRPDDSPSPGDEYLAAFALYCDRECGRVGVMKQGTSAMRQTPAYYSVSEWADWATGSLCTFTWLHHIGNANGLADGFNCLRMDEWRKEPGSWADIKPTSRVCRNYNYTLCLDS